MNRGAIFFDPEHLKDAMRKAKRDRLNHYIFGVGVALVIILSFTLSTIFPRQDLTLRNTKAIDDKVFKKIENITALRVLDAEGVRIASSIEVIPVCKPVIANKPETPKQPEPAKIVQNNPTLKLTQTSKKAPEKIASSSTTPQKQTTKQLTKPSGGDIKPATDKQLIDENLPVDKLDPKPVNANYGIPEYWPLPFPVSAKYGYLPERGRFHSGVDITAPNGELIYASGSGKVIRASWFAGYGNCIDIEHASGFITRYGHLSGYLVKVGDWIDEGQWIGQVGTTGNSSCYHLHFEVFSNGHTINPESVHWLNKVK